MQRYRDGAFLLEVRKRSQCGLLLFRPTLWGPGAEKCHSSVTVTALKVPKFPLQCNYMPWTQVSEFPVPQMEEHGTHLQRAALSKSIHNPEHEHKLLPTTAPRLDTSIHSLLSKLKAIPLDYQEFFFFFLSFEGKHILEKISPSRGRHVKALAVVPKSLLFESSEKGGPGIHHLPSLRAVRFHIRLIIWPWKFTVTHPHLSQPLSVGASLWQPAINLPLFLHKSDCFHVPGWLKTIK